MSGGRAKKIASSEISSGMDGADDAKCTVCGVTFFVCHGGVNEHTTAIACQYLYR